MSLSRKTSRNSMKGTPESDSEKESAVEDIDYTDNPELYYSSLKQLEKHSKKVRLHDTNLEKKMMEYLPVNEKFNMNKEGKVLTRWQERQRDWERIQSTINKKINSKSVRPLMMATTDEFRSRVEEYDLIQAALPLKDRYSEAAWQMTLRGGGPIYCSVGHIFSGIECKVEATVPKPKMIRKPKPTEATLKNDTFLEQTDALVKKINKYKQSITEIRPHNMSYTDASHLVVRSKNLYQWAKESTAAYFKEKEDAALSVVLEEDSISVGSSVKSVTKNANGNFDNGGLGPHVEYLGTKEVLFETQWNKNSTQTVSFRNIGTVAVSYRWRKLSNEKEPDSKKKRPASSASQMEMLTHGMKLSDIIQRKGVDEGKLRTTVLNRAKDNFFCLRDAGEILPDEIITTSFMFSSRCGAGIFSSQWVLELTPLDAVIYISIPSVLGLENEPPARCEGSLCISLRAAVDEPDENMKNRANIAAFVDRRTVETLAFDVVQDCLRRVRDPVRLNDLYSRQIDLFKRVNKQRLLDLSSKYTSLLPIFITPQRLDSFVSYYLTSSQSYVRIKALLASLRQQDNPELLVVNDSEVNPFVLSDETKTQLRTDVFPESLIEIFDEVTEEQLTPVWNYNLDTIYASLTELLAVVAEVEQTEARIAARQKQEAKERARAEARAARKAAGDDDEDEEEEEEEEPEEDDATSRKPKHPLLVEVEGLINGVGSAFNLLVTRPLEEERLFDLARGCVAEMSEGFNEWRATALASAGLLEMVNGGTALPQLPSPFTSAEGCEAWIRALATTSAVAEPVAPVKGAPKPAKGAPVVAAGPTSQQVDFFYREMYNLVRKGVLDMTETLFGSLDEVMESAQGQSNADFGLVGETLCTAAVPRVEDVSAVDAQSEAGKVAFVSFDGDAFVNNKHIRSAYDVLGQNKVRAVLPVSRLVEQAVKAIVLVYEPSHATEEQGDIFSAYDDIQNLITKQREVWIEENNKRIKKSNKLNKTKHPFPTYKKLDFLSSHSFAALNYQLDNLLRYGETRLIANNPQWSADQTTAYFAQYIPILLLQNVSFPGVVPSEPEYYEVESDDDEAPIYLGREEIKAKSRKDWESRRPFRVKVDLQVATLDGGKRKSTGLSSMAMQCYADCAAAVKEVFALASNLGDTPIWVEGTSDKLFAPEGTSALNKVKPIVSERLVSESVREDLVWCGVAQQLPGISSHWKNPEEGVELSPLTSHLRSLFPYSAHRDVKPNSVLVLGGTLRTDKFRTMDQLIDLVDSIVIVGEMAIPFIGLSYRVTLLRHQSTVAQYKAVCTHLVRKARLRGCRLMWPSDVIQGEDPLNPGDIWKCYDKFEPEARNEGAEYTGDTKTVNYLLDAPFPDDFHLATEEGHPALKHVVVDGYIYDIGPDTVRAMKDIVSAADLVLTWGTVGVCELSSFQVGQQSLVDVAAIKSPPTTVVPIAAQDLTRNPQLSLLLGDSCVEWFARLIDSDGDLKGDLVSAGCVTYASRNSAIPCGVLGQYPSAVLREEVKLRPAVEGEWVYSKRVIVPEEEEEEEEDEEEEN